MTPPQDTPEEKPERTSISDLFAENFPEAPTLYALILAMGIERGAAYNIDHLVFPHEKHCSRTPADFLLQQSGLDQIIHYDLTTLVDHLPGAERLAHANDPIQPDDWPGYHLLLAFTQSPTGHLLAESIRRAQHHDYKAGQDENSDNTPQALDNFLLSTKDAHFTTSLLELAKQESGKGHKNVFDCLVSDDTTDDLWKFVLLSTPITDRQGYMDFARGIDSAKKRKKRPPSTRDKVAEIIAYHWLSLVLWKKTSAAILDTLPELSLGEDGDSHETRCKSIDKAIQRLKLSRQN